MLQFHLTNFFGTKFKTHGVAIPKSAGLQLVFRQGEAPAKLFDKEIQSVLIEWKNLRNWEFKRGLLSTSLKIEVVSAAELGEFPSLDENTLTLKVHRVSVQDIEPFEDACQQYRSGKVDEDVDEFVDDVRDFLHGR